MGGRDAQRELGVQSSDQVPVLFVTETSIGRELIKMAPSLLMLGALLYFSRRLTSGMSGMGGGGGGGRGLFGMGKTTARMIHKETDIKVSFKDVAGCDED